MNCIRPEFAIWLMRILSTFSMATCAFYINDTQQILLLFIVYSTFQNIPVSYKSIAQSTTKMNQYISQFATYIATLLFVVFMRDLSISFIVCVLFALLIHTGPRELKEHGWNNTVETEIAVNTGREQIRNALAFTIIPAATLPLQTSTTLPQTNPLTESIISGNMV